MLKTKLAVYIKTKEEIEIKNIVVNQVNIICKYNKKEFIIKLTLIDIKIIFKNYNENNLTYFVLELRFNTNIDMISAIVAENIGIVAHDLKLFFNKREIIWSPVLIEDNYFYKFYK